MFKGHQNQKLQRARDRVTTFVHDCRCISTLPQPEKTCKQPEPGRTTRVNVFIVFSQVRAICVQIAYHSKLEVSSLRMPTAPLLKNKRNFTIRQDPCVFMGHTHISLSLSLFFPLSLQHDVNVARAMGGFYEAR